MLKEIIAEELGISNKVSLLTLRIKNLISNDFAKHKNLESFHYNMPLSNLKYVSVYGNKLTVNFENDKLSVLFFVLDKNDDAYHVYKSKYSSGYSSDKNQITLYLESFSNKIVWHESNSTIQHEVEHYFQTYKKGKPLSTREDIVKYNTFIEMFKSNDMYKQLIGGIYYFYTKVEQNAIVNGLYREIMEVNKFSYIEKPIEVLRENKHYKILNKLKHLFNEIINDDMMKEFISDELKELNKPINSFIKIANITFSEYTKKFSRTLFKAKKDLESKYGDVII